jgi:predicted phage terminase large subunit-like protein
MIITGIERDKELAVMKAQMLGSLLYFIQIFFKLRTGRPFSLSAPISRESHHITVCRELTRIFHGEIHRLIINLPPGHYKSTLLQHFVAWSWAHYPDCNFLYISYSHDEASKNTAVIRSIVSLPQYKQFFGVSIDPSSSARHDFKTNKGGTLKAFGSEGAVTGKDAGFPACDRFSGALIIDDAHKPDEVFSDAMRESTWKNYRNTIMQRVRGPNVAWIFLGQCLHEDDVAAKLKRGEDGYDWTRVVLKGLDEHDNALDPNVKTRLELLTMREFNDYVFYAQYQQDPQPAGGGIFKIENFYIIEEEPKFLTTFLTCDTAETDKTYNDATVFSFWGLYKINDIGRKEIEQYALHWIDCIELRVEPKFLESEFLSFYGECCMHKIPPIFAAIEKKSTGVTLVSTLSNIRGLSVRDIERTKSSGNKIARYFEIQPYINKKLVSLPANNKHTSMCIEHCRKITANNSHRHDDIADTLYDAVKIGLIEKGLINQFKDAPQDLGAKLIMDKFKREQQLRAKVWQR